MPNSLDQLNDASALQGADLVLIQQSGVGKKTTVADIVTQARTQNSGKLILTSDTDIELNGDLTPEMTGATGNVSVRSLGSATETFSGVYTENLTVSNSTGFTVSGDILPEMTGATADVSVRNIGSATEKFQAVYADEVFVGASSLYVNGKKVVEDNSDVMTFSTDEDQGVLIKTTASTPGSGSGSLNIEAGNILGLKAYGGLAFNVPADAASKNIVFTNSSTGTIIFNGDASFEDQLTIKGNLVVEGTTTTVNTEQVNINDNILELNSNQTGTPASTLVSGLSVNRGDSLSYRMVFEESTDTFKVGEQGNEQPVATREDNPTANGVAIWNDTNRMFESVTTNTAFNKSFGTVADSVAEGNHLHDGRYYTKTEVNDSLALKADSTHSHNDVYYTETEVDGLLSNKSNTGHNHDDRYYTESEVDTKLGTKADSTHNHDTVYYTQSQVDTMLANRPVFTSGTSFPVSPNGGDECFRTDQDKFFKYTGSEWVQI